MPQSMFERLVEKIRYRDTTDECTLIRIAIKEIEKYRYENGDRATLKAIEEIANDTN